MRAPGGARFAYNPDIPRPPEAHLPMNSPLSDTDQLADARGWWFVQRGREVLLDETGGVPCGPNPLLGLDPLPALQVGEFDGMPCFAVELPLEAEPAARERFSPRPASASRAWMAVPALR